MTSSPMHAHPHFIRLIASDLDGTLLREDKTVSGRTVAAVRAATQAGIAVVAATGRQAPQLPDEVTDAGVTHVVASNGAIGVDLRDGKVLFQDLLAPATAAAIAEYFLDRLPEARFCAVRDFGGKHAAEPGYLDLLTDWEREYNWWLMRSEPLESVLIQPTLKLTVRHPELGADDLWDVLAESGLTGFHATTSGAPFLEIAGEGVTKASGLAKLCLLLEIEATEVLAAGDAKNDLELISWAGVGVAMGNAVPEALAVADWITASNDDDGLALAIEAVLTSSSVEQASSSLVEQARSAVSKPAPSSLVEQASSSVEQARSAMSKPTPSSLVEQARSAVSKPTPSSLVEQARSAVSKPDSALIGQP